MIDRDSRDRVALALRQFASGRLAQNELYARTTRARDSTDPGVTTLAEAIYWQFLNLGPKRLVGRHALSREARRGIARWVLFLRSNEPYVWPQRGPSFWDVVHAFATLGKSWIAKCERWSQTGDEKFWPFVSEQQLARVAAEHPFVRRLDPSA
jgi:hypothetical protein